MRKELSHLVEQNFSWVLRCSQVRVPSSCCCQVASVVSGSVQPHRWQPTRLPSPWDSQGKNTGVACHFLLQCMKVKVKSLSRVRLLLTPRTVAHQAPPSMGFSRQESWSGLPLPSLGDRIFPTRIQRGLPHCRQTLYCLSHQGSPGIHRVYLYWIKYKDTKTKK